MNKVLNGYTLVSWVLKDRLRAEFSPLGKMDSLSSPSPSPLRELRTISSKSRGEEGRGVYAVLVTYDTPLGVSRPGSTPWFPHTCEQL